MNLKEYIKSLPVDHGMNDSEIVESYNNALDRYKELWLTPEGAISRLGTVTAGKLLTALETAAQANVLIRWANKRLQSSQKGLNVSDIQTRGVVQNLVSEGLLSQPAADAILALPEDTHDGDATLLRWARIIACVVAARASMEAAFDNGWGA